MCFPSFVRDLRNVIASPSSSTPLTGSIEYAPVLHLSPHPSNAPLLNTASASSGGSLSKE